MQYQSRFEFEPLNRLQFVGAVFEKQKTHLEFAPKDGGGSPPGGAVFTRVGSGKNQMRRFGLLLTLGFDTRLCYTRHMNPTRGLLRIGNCR